ncbi:hypothetical protein [Microcoleus sp. FACHB-SPT15]|uniref:hypothetical protein n=1 Tax=Microcoleus sp. FACHB-SPT15 TaxID=2692830 RepID=UPI001A7EFAFE|nr:hypothetical protein [Microcoleus sp. FACHB-SPT15]
MVSPLLLFAKQQSNRYLRFMPLQPDAPFILTFAVEAMGKSRFRYSKLIYVYQPT